MSIGCRYLKAFLKISTYWKVLSKSSRTLKYSKNILKGIQTSTWKRKKSVFRTISPWITLLWKAFWVCKGTSITKKRKKRKREKNAVTFRRHSAEPDKVLIEERLILQFQTCTEFAEVHCCILESIFSPSILMSLLVKGWKDHRLSIKQDCQSYAVSNSAVIYILCLQKRDVWKNEPFCVLWPVQWDKIECAALFLKGGKVGKFWMRKS